jgi:hypothetical protein
MTTLNEKASVLAGLLTLGLCGTSSADAVEVPKPYAENPTCHMEARRIALWRHGPWKGMETPRYVIRSRFVCDRNDTKSASESTPISRSRNH